ncbi:MAG: transcription antitermination factor NusB [Erysipelothrix sp.]|nr:transcription antitermination factor NusB [Erysipelothrix sp.]
MNRTQIRELGIICVYQSLVLKKDIYEVINNHVEDATVKRDLFFLNITTNLFEHFDYVKNIVSEKLENWEFERLGYIEQAILLVAVVELLSEDADKAVIINEAIEYTKKYADTDSFKLINGVLDKI